MTTHNIFSFFLKLLIKMFHNNKTDNLQNTVELLDLVLIL